MTREELKQLVAETGKNPVVLWREHAGLPRKELARRADISYARLMHYETGGPSGIGREFMRCMVEAGVPAFVLSLYRWWRRREWERSDLN